MSSSVILSFTLVTRYVGLELRRAFRDVGFVVFGIGTPVLMYVMFTNVGDGSARTPDWALSAMVGLAAFGALSSGLTSGTAVAEDKAAGWLRRLRVTPLTSAQVVVGRSLTGSLMVLPAIIVVLVTALIANGVRLQPWQWLVLILVLWVGSLPFTMLGIANGYQLSSQTANVTNILCNLVLALLGGLWFPVSEFPGWLAPVATWTPGHLFARLGWDTAGGRAPSLTSAAGLAGWLLLFSAYAAYAYRRSGRKA
ncbi:ABC transporter permease [Streptomyces sp. MA5143a]|uniref:ABC transporter permease n=1 Tax=Streptomyces sp. MA5143a TaxID=2083010 RepID=UPI000D28FC24|nr:ABC transporter permease [Streptomyces sp. MA5143a]SPF00235.1 daunorubicin resistance ABC transporter membrane protein [Streptomyces sp. MA5143a]